MFDFSPIYCSQQFFLLQFSYYNSSFTISKTIIVFVFIQSAFMQIIFLFIFVYLYKFFCNLFLTKYYYKTLFAIYF